jgi:hypothetical protein
MDHIYVELTCGYSKAKIYSTRTLPRSFVSSVSSLVSSQEECRDVPFLGNLLPETHLIHNFNVKRARYCWGHDILSFPGTVID